MTNLAFLCRSWVGDSSGFTTFNLIICSRLIIDRSNTQRPQQNGRFWRRQFQMNFPQWKCLYFYSNLLLFVHEGPALVMVMAWCPLSAIALRESLLIQMTIAIMCHWASYAQLRVAHAPGMPGTLSPPPRVSDPDMHPGTCVTHVPGCMSGSLTRGFHWCLWRGKRSRHSRCMHNP